MIFQVIHHFTDNQYIKESHFPAGYAMGKHVHSFSHFSILTQGRVTLEVDGISSELVAPAIIEVKAHCEHVIRIHEDAIWLCTHALTDGEFDADPSKIDEQLIAKGK